MPPREPLVLEYCGDLEPPKSRMSARRYFRRSGTLLLVPAIMMVPLGLVFAPDNLGRGLAGLFASILVVGAISRLRTAATVSPTAVVHERVVPGQRRVTVVIEERG